MHQFGGSSCEFSLVFLLCVARSPHMSAMLPMLQVLVVGQPAVQTELLFGNYYGKPAGKVTSPLQAIQVGPGTHYERRSIS